MPTPIDTEALKQIARHHAACGLTSRLRGLPYERCAELPWVVRYLRPRFGEPLRYLDIGSGASPLPTFILRNSRWDVTCLDKFHSVRKQFRFLEALGPNGDAPRFHVVEKDLLESGLPSESFDVVTIVSVIEHFEGGTDSAAMRTLGRLLRPGGQVVLTTLMNEPHYREFYLREHVYGEEFRGKPVFYQRHYDVRSLSERIIKPSGLAEKERVYFGDYGFQCFERVMQQPKALRALYMWSTPRLASRFLTYDGRPVSREGMRMNTASGVILVLEKPGSHKA